MIHPRVNGVWLGQIAPFGEVTWSHGEHGCLEAGFSVALPRGRQHPLLVGRPLVELMNGPKVMWSGLMAEPDWAEGRFTAGGLYKEAEHIEALDGVLAPTSTSSTAVDQAIARAGWQVTRGAGVPTTAYSTTPDARKVGGLLDPVADELGQWWHVRADRVVRFTSAPTTPTWHLAPGLVTRGSADDDYASAIIVKYFNSGAGGAAAQVIRTDAEAIARFGRREYVLDATTLGSISTARANGLGDGILAKGRARLGWTSTIELSYGQVTNPGGVAASLSLIESHQMLRIPMAYDDVAFLGGRTYIDAVIGEVQLAAASRRVSISPLGSVAEKFDQVVQATLTAAKGKAA